MISVRVVGALLGLLLSGAALAEPLMQASDLIPRSREALLLSKQEQEFIAGYRRDQAYASVTLFLANVAALSSDVITVAIDGKTYRFVGSKNGPVQDSWSWTGGKNVPLEGPPSAQFTWTDAVGRLDRPFSLSGQIVVDGKLHNIGTLGRFQVLLVNRNPLRTIPVPGNPLGTNPVP
jgi:hypothetical protein